MAAVVGQRVALALGLAIRAPAIAGALRGATRAALGRPVATEQVLEEIAGTRVDVEAALERLRTAAAGPGAQLATVGGRVFEFTPAQALVAVALDVKAGEDLLRDLAELETQLRTAAGAGGAA